MPVDFSTMGRKAIKKAIEIRGDSDAEIILAHIIDYAPPAYVAVEMPAIFASANS